MKPIQNLSEEMAEYAEQSQEQFNMRSDEHGDNHYNYREHSDSGDAHTDGVWV
jgi:hypothetical protein